MPAEIRQEHDLPFPVERVWRALTDHEEVRQWMSETDIEPVKGHQFEFRDKAHATWDGIIHCEVLEVEPPHRIAYAWQTAKSGRHRVEITLRPTTSGTKLLLRHSGFQGFSEWALKVMVTGGYHILFRKRLPSYLRTGAPQRAFLSAREA